MFENWQGINPMSLSASLAEYQKTILHKYENVTEMLNMKYKKNKGIDPMVLCSLWADSLLTTKNYQNIENNHFFKL